MQRCGKVNNTMIWWSRKTDKMNCFKVIIWRRFYLTILKVKQIYYKRIEFFTNRFNLKSIATSSSNLLTRPCTSSKSTNSFSSWIYTNTSHLAYDFEIPLKGFKSPSIMILMQQLCSTKFLTVVLASVDSCVVKRYKIS